MTMPEKNLGQLEEEAGAVTPRRTSRERLQMKLKVQEGEREAGGDSDASKERDKRLVGGHFGRI